MGKIALQIKATLENIERLTANPGYNFILKIKCSQCGEVSEKWHDLDDQTTVEAGKSICNFVMKCKLCSREMSISIIPGKNYEYNSDDQGKYKTIVVFECRGLEPIEFAPTSGWSIKIEGSSKVFEDVDLTDKEWVEYDENIKNSVGVYEFESQFVKMK